MYSFSAFKDDYEQVWSTLTIRPSARAELQRRAERLVAGKPEYQRVESRTGVPWWFVGLCHYRESDFNFATYLGNGQSLSRRTTIVPKDRGPFTGADAFLQGAVDALRQENFIGAQDWSIARVLYRLEGFNGYGYHGRRVNSPYLWCGSTAYGPPETRGGKYVRDGVFDPNTVDQQFGTAVLLKTVMDLDATIAFGVADVDDPDRPQEPDDEAAGTILWLQQSLNRLGTTPPLAEDGRIGPKTMTATSVFQQGHGLADTGLADARTVAALQAALQPAAAPAVDPGLSSRVSALEQRLAAAARQPAGPPTPLPEAAVPVDGLAALRRLFPALDTARPSDPLWTAAQALLAAATGLTGQNPPLGQVNGALGQTIGGLMDGKKTAIGILGALATQVLSQVPAASGLGQVLGLITPALGLSPYTLPIFLAIAAWGILGKFEKWTQQSGQAAVGPAAAARV